MWKKNLHCHFSTPQFLCGQGFCSNFAWHHKEAMWLILFLFCCYHGNWLLWNYPLGHQDGKHKSISLFHPVNCKADFVILSYCYVSSLQSQSLTSWATGIPRAKGARLWQACLNTWGSWNCSLFIDTGTGRLAMQWSHLASVALSWNRSHLLVIEPRTFGAAGQDHNHLTNQLHIIICRWSNIG